MDVSGIAGLASALSQVQVGNAVSVQVLKKAMDTEAQGALQLLQALPQPTNNPAHLGQNIDVKA